MIVDCMVIFHHTSFSNGLPSVPVFSVQIFDIRSIKEFTRNDAHNCLRRNKGLQKEDTNGGDLRLQSVIWNVCGGKYH